MLAMQLGEGVCVSADLAWKASNTEGNLEYRRLLIRALHACTGYCSSSLPKRHYCFSHTHPDDQVSILIRLRA